MCASCCSWPPSPPSATAPGGRWWRRPRRGGAARRPGGGRGCAKKPAPDKANELAAIPPLLERLGAEDGLKGALVSIDAIATNPAVAEAITAQGAGWLLAVKANQPTLRAEVEAAFAEAGDGLDACVTLDKGHGRVEQRRMTVLRVVDWLAGARRFPGELRLPATACLLETETRVKRAGGTRTETRYLISSRALGAADAAEAAREHWAIENRLRLGCSRSPSETTGPAGARATVPATWPPCATSPPTSSAPPPTGARSSLAGRSQAGTPTISTPSSPHAPPTWMRSPGHERARASMRRGDDRSCGWCVTRVGSPQ
jgi:predicted transposase YbfD/YdcC